jgi:hypothetical protein
MKESTVAAGMSFLTAARILTVMIVNPDDVLTLYGICSMHFRTASRQSAAREHLVKRVLDLESQSLCKNTVTQTIRITMTNT